MAGAQLYMKDISWKLEKAAKIASYIFLIVKNGPEVDFERNICLAGKVRKWK